MSDEQCPCTNRDVSYSTVLSSTYVYKFCLTKLYEICFRYVLFTDSLYIRWQFVLDSMVTKGRSHWPSGLRRGSVASRLLRFLVRIPLGTRMFVSSECCVSSGRGLCDELITRPEESYRPRCVVVCDLETSRMRRPWPTLGRSATGIKKIHGYESYAEVFLLP